MNYTINFSFASFPINFIFAFIFVISETSSCMVHEESNFMLTNVPINVLVDDLSV